MRRILAAIALALLLPAVAGATSAPRGALRQLPGASGCLIAPARLGCAPARGMGSTQNVVVSPDGRDVYAVSNDTWGLVAFRRSAATGLLTQLPGATGCLTASSRAPGCGAARGTVWAFWIAISPDGRDVYVSGGSGNSIAHLRRNRFTGRLSQPAGQAGCLRNATGGTGRGGPPASASGCRLASGLTYPRGIAVSPDGRFVYAAAFDGAAVITYARDPSTGSLSPVQGGCATSRSHKGCALAAGLDGATGIVLSPDGHFAYATAYRYRNGAVDAFSVDPGTGVLTQLSGLGGCVAAVASSGCVAGRGLRGASA